MDGQDWCQINPDHPVIMLTPSGLSCQPHGQHHHKQTGATRKP